MKVVISFIILLFLYSYSLSENKKSINDDNWTLIWNKDSTLFGYEDKNGVVKIEQKYMGFNRTLKFENIISVIDTSDGWSGIYITKSGRIVGKDSIYFFDNHEDCESEGLLGSETVKQRK